MGKPGAMLKSGSTTMKSVEKVEMGSPGSPWIKSMSSLVVVLGAMIFAYMSTVYDPSTLSTLSIQDITSSSSSAVHVLNGLHHDTDLPIIAEVILDASVEQIVAVQPEPLEEVVALAEILAQDQQQFQQQQQQQQAGIVEWMIQGGAVFPNIELVEYTGHDEYRGIHATADLSADDVLAEIPYQFIITFDRARESEIGQRIIKALPEYGDLEMSHHLISLFLVVEYDKAEGSWWWPYLQTLPTQFRNMPPNYTPEEAELARQSRIEYVLGDRFQSDYDEICEAVAEFCQQYSFAKYKWGRLVLRSRAFSLDVDGVDQTALQPFVDMINHDFSNVASWRYDQEARRGEIYAKRPIKAGDIVTISYGVKSNRLLLRTYGFVIMNNPNHEASLYLQLPDGESASGMLALRVAKTGNPSTEFYRIQHTLTLSTSDDEFKAGIKLCRVAVATRAELGQYDSFDVPVSLQNEAQALRYMRESIDETLYKQTTMVDQDEVLLKSSSLSDNERNIITTRYSEKITLIMMNEILEDLIDIVDPSVDHRSFNKLRYHQKYAAHIKYLRLVGDLRRSSR